MAVQNNLAREQYIEERSVTHLHHWTKIGFLAAAMVVLLLIPLDYLAVPEHAHSFVIYRLVTVAVFLFLYLLNRRTVKRSLQSGSVMAGGVAAAVMVAAMVHDSQGHGTPYFAGFMIIAIIISFIPLSFRINVLLQLLVYAIFLLPLIFYERIVAPEFFLVASVLTLAGIIMQISLQYLRGHQSGNEFGLEYDRHLAMAALHTRENHLAESQSVAHVGSWERNLANDEVFWSAELFRILGLNPESDAASFPAFLARVHPEDREKIQVALRETLELRKPYALAVRIILNDGIIRVIQIKGEIVADSAGQPVLMRGTAQDITERWLAEENLKQSLSLLKAALQATADGILVVAKDGTISEFNRQFAKMWGLPEPVIETRDDGKLLAFVLDQLEDPAQFLAKVQELYAKPWCTSLDVLRFKDGRMLERYSQPQIIDSNVVGRVWSFRDVSEQRQAEQDLRASEEKFRAIYNNIGSGVAVIGQDMQILSLNPLMQQWFPHIDSAQKHICYQSFNTPPRDSVCTYCPTVLTLQDGQVHTAETDTPTPEGVRHYQIISSPLLAADGSVYAAIEMVQDITERKQAEGRLKQLAQELKTILDTLTVGVSFLKNRRVQWANASHDRIFGFGPDESKDQDVSLTYADAEVGRRVGSEGYAQLAKGGAYSTEAELLHRDGTHFWCSIPGRAVNPDDLGEGSIWMLQDITERKRVGQALQASEQKYRQLVEAANSVILHWETDGRILFINEYGARFFGYSPEELVGRSVLGSIVPEVDSSGRELGQMIRSIESNPEQYRANENENITKDGRRVWLRWENRAINDEDGKLKAVLSIGYDISDRKAADQALRESEARFRSLFENANVAVFIHDQQGMVLHANHKALVDTGLNSLEELRAKDFWLPAPYSLADARCWLQKAAEEGPQHFEWHDCNRQGRSFWRDMTLKKIILDGQPRIIAVAVDITDRKLAEAELQGKSHQLEALTKTLEQRVKDEVSLRMRSEQILVQQSKLAAMGETLGAIAHQWRQPLNALGLIIQNLADAKNFGELDDQLLEDTVGKSMSQIQHMSKTIDDFRNFFRPDKEKTVFATIGAAADVLTLVAAQLQANGIDFRLTCHTCQQTFADPADLTPCPDTSVLGYRNEFEHVLLNLVNNARDAILESRQRSGGPEQGKLAMDFHKRGDKVVIEVSDNGGGLPPGVLARVFEPYFTTKEPTKGTGLGLYMSLVIIEEHMGGSITAANGDGGALFIIELQQMSERRGDERAAEA